MTEAQKIFRNNLLAKIHTQPFCKEAKQNDSWGEYLKGLYGVESSKYLSIEELINLLDVLKGKTTSKVCGSREVVDKRFASLAQIEMIKSLWESKARDGSALALRNFIFRIVHIRPLHLENLSKIEATNIILAIKRL